MTNAIDHQQGRPKAAGLVTGALSTAIAVLLATVALTARQPPPPAIAEFAPQAVQQITETQTDQTSDEGLVDGAGPGGDPAAPPDNPTANPTTGPGVPTTGPTAAPPTLVPRKTRCVGEPPRQTEDPQSPPCVPFFQGDNGGATNRGVTGEEILIAIQTAKKGEVAPDMKTFQDYFNSRYEFYGRKIKLVDFQSGPSEIASMLADAQKVDDLGVFAVAHYQSQGNQFTSTQQGRQSYFFDELARRGILGVTGADFQGPPASYTQEHLRKTAPYIWTYLPTIDTILSNLGEMICSSLAGKPPTYAAGDQREKPVRVFGVASPEYTDGSAPIDLDPLRANLSRCGTDIRTYSYNPDDYATITPKVQSMVQDGVTSVLCLCEVGRSTTSFLQNAENQLYFPEWLMTNFIANDFDFTIQSTPASQRDQVLGLKSASKLLPESERFAFRACKEIDPAITRCNQTWYDELQVLAAGIQLAGPDLTPENFERGLQEATFPNPGAQQAPHYQARVRYGAGHSATQDFAPIWFNNTARSLETPALTGAYCYVDVGRRYGVGQWPADLGFQEGSCR